MEAHVYSHTSFCPNQLLTTWTASSRNLETRTCQRHGINMERFNIVFQIIFEEIWNDEFSIPTRISIPVTVLSSISKRTGYLVDCGAFFLGGREENPQLLHDSRPSRGQYSSRKFSRVCTVHFSHQRALHETAVFWIACFVQRKWIFFPLFFLA